MEYDVCRTICLTAAGGHLALDKRNYLAAVDCLGGCGLQVFFVPANTSVAVSATSPLTLWTAAVNRDVFGATAAVERAAEPAVAVSA